MERNSMKIKVSDYNYEPIGKRIKNARLEKKYTQEFVAEKLNVSCQHISALERGLNGMSIPTLVELCKVLEIDADYKYAKKIWANTMEGYLKDKDNTWYSKPNNVVGVLVDPISGEIESESTKKRKVFYYINGTEPFNTQDVLNIIE